MAYKRGSSGPSTEIEKLQTEITDEVNTDAEHLATAVFGKVSAMPDVARVSDQVLDARYRQAYQSQDRQWLINESHRDPEQFLEVSRRLGVQLPDELGQNAAPPPPAPPPPALAAPAQPPIPPTVAAPAPLTPPALAPPMPLAPAAPVVAPIPQPPVV